MGRQTGLREAVRRAVERAVVTGTGEVRVWWDEAYAPAGRETLRLWGTTPELGRRAIRKLTQGKVWGGAPVGAVVGLFYDGRRVVVGEYLRTRTGRTYQAVTVRVQQKGAHPGRQHLRCLVVEEAQRGVRVHPLCWYPRGKRRERAWDRR